LPLRQHPRRYEPISGGEKRPREGNLRANNMGNGKSKGGNFIIDNHFSIRKVYLGSKVEQGEARGEGKVAILMRLDPNEATIS